MAQTADIDKTRYEELRKNPVFFLKFFESICNDNNGDEIDNSRWSSIDRELNITLDAKAVADRELGYALCILEGKEKVDEKGNQSSDTITIKFHCVAPNSVNDWISSTASYYAPKIEKTSTLLWNYFGLWISCFGRKKR